VDAYYGLGYTCHGRVIGDILGTLVHMVFFGSQFFFGGMDEEPLCKECASHLCAKTIQVL
jgi:hypothetical protein